MRVCNETLAHAHLRRPYGTGPCFSPVRRARTRRPILQPAPGRDSLVVPEGAPLPPECSCRVHEPAGAAPRPASTFASRSALQVDEVMRSLSQPRRAGTSFDLAGEEVWLVKFGCRTASLQR